ncbi:hypothetical protein EJD97_005070 [Solanum chilense]|uniref:Gag-pol polyprotein n=1 Tax=Solanum chilense TaxID=4083 RepID=A0A6N2BVV8_SOLCI|nr:hypothetical protein EJD97_005070 [Solanum chilense]
MNTRRLTARREEPQVPTIRQAPFVEGDMTNADLRPAVMNLTQLIMAQAHVVNNHFVTQDNQGVGPQPNASTPASTIGDFMTMNPPTFHGTKVDEDPQGFIYEIFNVVDAMGVTPRDKAELSACQLKEVAQVWYEQWRGERPLEKGPVE